MSTRAALALEPKNIPSDCIHEHVWSNNFYVQIVLNEKNFCIAKDRTFLSETLNSGGNLTNSQWDDSWCILTDPGFGPCFDFPLIAKSWISIQKCILSTYHSTARAVRKRALARQSKTSAETYKGLRSEASEMQSGKWTWRIRNSHRFFQLFLVRTKSEHHSSNFHVFLIDCPILTSMRHLYFSDKGKKGSFVPSSSLVKRCKRKEVFVLLCLINHKISR